MDTKLSKSNVLVGVQDAYWSDDEPEDSDCPLCMDQMDLSDMGFKPCPCGYQICRFCWHHIKENLNGRCPACRREYTEEAVQFTAVSPEDLKRLNQQRKVKEKERKELEALNRKHLTNIRVVQRNVVFITGMGPKFAREELISTLRSSEYFGQYGKISKILLVKRSNAAEGGKPVVGLYVTYHRREDASRAIAAVDGTPSPSGTGETTRASYGTTKYCTAFLRNVSCSNKGCLDLHEWGDERDCFTKEDLTTIKHTIKDTEMNGKKSHESSEFRRSNWSGSAAPKSSHSSYTSGKTIGPIASIRGRVKDTVASSRPTRTSRMSGDPVSNRRDKEKEKDPTRKEGGAALNTSLTHTKRPSHGSSNSRPSSPAIHNVETVRARTPAADSDKGSSVAGHTPSPHLEPVTTIPVAHSKPSLTKVSVPETSVLSAPPGLPAPSTSYQPSTAAQALLDDVRLRRHRSAGFDSASSSHAPSNISPFPDFDRTLRNLGFSSPQQDGEPGMKFSFELDPSAAVGGSKELTAIDESFDEIFTPPPGLSHSSSSSGVPYSGNFNPFDSGAISESRWSAAFAQSPRSTDPLARLASSPATQGSSVYRGAFDPFSDEAGPSKSSPALSHATSTDGERAISRFGFARRPTPSVRPGLAAQDGHYGSPSVSSIGDVLPASPFLSQLDVISPKPTQTSWSSQPQVSSRPSSIQMNAPPPGLTQPGSIHLSQLFGSSYVARNPPTPSEVLTAPPGLEGGLPPPGLAPRPSIGTNNDSSGLNHGFVDPAIMSTKLAGSTLPLKTFVDSNPLLVARESSSNVASPTNASIQSFDSYQLSSVGLNDYRAASRMRSESHSNASLVHLVGEPSIPSTPNHASLTSSSAVDSPVVEEPSRQLLPQDFPALPSSGTTDSQTRAPVLQPHVTPIVPKIVENKPVGPKIDKSKESSKKDAVKSKPPVEPITARQVNEDKKKPSKAAKTTVPEPPAPKVVNAHTPQAASVPPKHKHKPAAPVPEPEAQAPMLSRQSKKEKKSKATKPKPAKLMKEEDRPYDSQKPSENPPQDHESTTAMKVLSVDGPKTDSKGRDRTSIVDFLQVIDGQMNLALNELAFFNPERISPKSQAPLQYAPLVHALSALSVGGGTFSNNLPSRSIDTAVSSFQTLLETLTQTISDLLRLLPRTTWDDSSSFDGVLRDMLKGDDFFDEPGEDGTVKEDEVAALTQALERRARWMEVQLSKLEELHHDINTAAVRAVLSFNDRGWDPKGFLPKLGGSAARFEGIGKKEAKGVVHKLSVHELEKKLEKAIEAEQTAESELRKSVEFVANLKCQALDDWVA